MSGSAELGSALLAEQRKRLDPSGLSGKASPGENRLLSQPSGMILFSHHQSLLLIN